MQYFKVRTINMGKSKITCMQGIWVQKVTRGGIYAIAPKIAQGQKKSVIPYQEPNVQTKARGPPIPF